MSVNSNQHQGRIKGGAQAWPQYFYLQNFFRALYICPYANTCLKISSCIDLKCLLYVCATVKIQFAITILNHTHPPLGRYASSLVRAPLFEHSGSAPEHRQELLAIT